MTQQHTDYTTWQHADLIERVHELERQLRETTQELAEIAEKQASRKPPRPFIASNHSTRKIALKFAYLGANYNGLEHHNGNVTSLPAVEKVLWQALVKTRLITPQYKEGQDENEVSWEGCEYSKCGRTDKGVSSFGQVIGIRVRSARPMPMPRNRVQGENDGPDRAVNGETFEEYLFPDQAEEEPFDDVKDELPYIFMLNRVLPPDIRVLAWCARPPPDFDARFSCRERRYRYFFTNPAFLPLPGHDHQGERWLDIDAMRLAAKKYEGLHDFRNFCKIDGAKQITNFERRIFRASIHGVQNSTEDAADATNIGTFASPKLYYFEVRGSAFLWHQVRHLVAVLFLVGQGLEQPGIVDQLLNVERTPGRPNYQMASDEPLVLWDCIFPDRSDAAVTDHGHEDGSAAGHGYADSLPWLNENDSAAPRTKTLTGYVNDLRYDRDGVLETLWSQWRGCKLREVLAHQLMTRVAGVSNATSGSQGGGKSSIGRPSARVFEGGDRLRSVGPYVPMLQRSKFANTPDVVNSRYVARKKRLEDEAFTVGEK